MSFKAVIPAAGEGKRLLPHTKLTPKVLVEVAGKPIIGHIMDRLLRAGPDEVCVVVGDQGELVERYLTGSYSCRFRFVRQDDPKGLGDAVFRARNCFQGEPVFILLGDTIIDADMTELVGAENVVGVKEVSDPRRFGIAEVEGGLVKRLVEKPEHPSSNLALVGVYHFTDSRALFGALAALVRQGKQTRGEFQLTDAIQLMVDSGVRIRTSRIEHWFDCGTPDALLDTNRHLLTQDGYFRAREGAVVIPPVYIHDRATVESSVVGPSVSVGPGAVIRNSIVSDSIVNRDAAVEDSVLEKSILGESSSVRGARRRVNLGAFSELEIG